MIKADLGVIQALFDFRLNTFFTVKQNNSHKLDCSTFNLSLWRACGSCFFFFTLQSITLLSFFLLQCYFTHRFKQSCIGHPTFNTPNETKLCHSNVQTRRRASNLFHIESPFRLDYQMVIYSYFIVVSAMLYTLLTSIQSSKHEANLGWIKFYTIGSLWTLQWPKRDLTLAKVCRHEGRWDSPAWLYQDGGQSLSFFLGEESARARDQSRAWSFVCIAPFACSLGCTRTFYPKFIEVNWKGTRAESVLRCHLVVAFWIFLVQI